MPELALRGWEQRSGGTEVQLTVNNRDQIPDELFAAAPHLPPCGLNTNSSRTWVDIYSDGSRIYDFCGLGAADSLDGLWFFVSENAPRPHFVHIELNDRQCDQVYPSNTIEIPSSIPFSPLQSSSNQSTHSVPDTPTNRPQPIQLPPTNTQQPPSIPPTPTWTPMPDGG
ncbi:hypothetical protein KFU94_11150 [Chloroflexi bacterium TSY]|nr:hypothetical protein [Chloroflexi bacterium TSY]